MKLSFRDGSKTAHAFGDFWDWHPWAAHKKTLHIFWHLKINAGPGIDILGSSSEAAGGEPNIFFSVLPVVQSSLQSFFFPTFGAFQVWSPLYHLISLVSSWHVSWGSTFSPRWWFFMVDPCWSQWARPKKQRTSLKDRWDLQHSEWRWLDAGCCWKRVLERLLANIGQLKKDKADKDTQFFLIHFWTSADMGENARILPVTSFESFWTYLLCHPLLFWSTGLDPCPMLGRYHPKAIIWEPLLTKACEVGKVGEGCEGCEGW